MVESGGPIYDKCSLWLFVDEGCLFQKLLLHSERFPDSTPYLANTTFPFCALIVHDSVRFVRDCFDPSFPIDSESVNRLRNAIKSLSSVGLSVEEYSAEVREITDFLYKEFKNHTGIFSSLKNLVQPDVGISYYNKKPVYTTFNMSRYLSKYNTGEIDAILDPGTARRMGYDIGQAARPSYYAVKILDTDPSMLPVEEFKMTCRDFQYSNLLKPIAECGLTNPVYFFMLCEGFTQINSVRTLHESGVFSDLLELKMATAVLVALEKSLSKLSRYIVKSPEFEKDPARANQVLSKVIPRNQRKVIKKAKDLRNALVHYDFIKLLGRDICKNQEAEAILDMATKRTVAMSSVDYLSWLEETSEEIANNIDSLIKLPRY